MRRSFYTYYYRRHRRGLSVKDSLTNDISRSPSAHKCKDHLGHEFSSIKEMCKYWNIKVGTYNQRKKLNWNLKDILEKKPRKHKNWTDFQGNKFHTIKEMCEYWGIKPSTYYWHKNRGLSFEEIVNKK